jgi:queuine tRNA-ribosyltransferase
MASMTTQLKSNLRNIFLGAAEIHLPVFLPDATFGVVRSVDARDLLDCHIQAVVMNTYHLMQKPGSSTINSLGGLHRMSGWQRPIITDSGGFQAYSLIHQNPKFGSITDKGIDFIPEGGSRKFQLTPEKSIQLQIAYGSDVVICLDDCTHVDAPVKEQEQSVSRTVAWAKRSRRTFDRLLDEKKMEPAKRPRLFAVIQGGGIPDLRRQCAEELLAIGFDGYGFGGWPLDGKGKLLEDILGFTRSLIPATLPMHALGVGHPENVKICFDLGYALFDSAMPTRDARHGRLYTFQNPPTETEHGLDNDWLDYLYIEDDRHIKADRPISPYCDCPVCSHYSLGYLRHLFKIGDLLITRLCTLHNLRFMTQLTDRLSH